MKTEPIDLRYIHLYPQGNVRARARRYSRISEVRRGKKMVRMIRIFLTVAVAWVLVVAGAHIGGWLK